MGKHKGPTLTSRPALEALPDDALRMVVAGFALGQPPVHPAPPPGVVVPSTPTTTPGG